MMNQHRSSGKTKGNQSQYKIQQLYEQFQILKKRIATSQSKREHSNNKNKSIPKYIPIKKDNFQAFQQQKKVKYTHEKIKFNYNHNISVYQNFQKESSYLDLQTKNILKLKVIKFFNDSVFQIQKKYRAKMDNLQQRLVCVNQLINKIVKIMKFAVKRQLSQQQQVIGGICQKSDEVFKTAKAKHKQDQKTKRLRKVQEARICVLMNQIKDLAATSSTQDNFSYESKKIIKNLQLQVKKLEKKFFDKESQFNKEKLQSSKLIQQISKFKKKLREKQELPNQLKNQITNKNIEIERCQKEIEQLNKKIITLQKIEKDLKAFKSSSLLLENIKKRENQWSQKLLQAQDKILTLEQEKIIIKLQLSSFQQKHKKLEKKMFIMLTQNTKKQQQIRDLTKKQTKLKIMQKTVNELALENQRLRKQIKKLIDQKNKSFGKSTRKQSQQIKTSNETLKENQQINKLNNRKFSVNKQFFSLNGNQKDKKEQINFKQESKQKDTLNEQDSIILKYKNKYKNNHLGHSHLLLPNQRRQIQKQMKIRQLQSQLNLIYQQNKILKLKKDIFEKQVKNSQNDQQKFQIQSDILRQQIKRLNFNIKILDQCAQNLLLKKQLCRQKIDKLYCNDKDLKFPQRYKKTVNTEIS